MVALSMYDTVDFVRSGVAAGACGYVMTLVAQGRSSKEIAFMLGLSRKVAT